jgi:hypothetical protein
MRLYPAIHRSAKTWPSSIKTNWLLLASRQIILAGKNPVPNRISKPFAKRIWRYLPDEYGKVSVTGAGY